MNLVITVPADVLAPNGARPSAGTVNFTMGYQYNHYVMLSYGHQDDISH